MELKSFPGAESVRDITFTSADGTTVYEVATFPNPAHDRREITRIWKIGAVGQSMPDEHEVEEVEEVEEDEEDEEDEEEPGSELGPEEGPRSHMRYIARVEYYNWNTFSVRVANQQVVFRNQTGTLERHVEFTARDGNDYEWIADDSHATLKNERQEIMATYTRGSSAGILGFFGLRNPQPSTFTAELPVLPILDEVFATCIYAIHKAQIAPFTEAEHAALGIPMRRGQY